MTVKNKGMISMQTTTTEFDYIYNEYFTPLYRYCLSQTKNKEVAEDIIQNVFLKVLKKFPPDQLPPLPYFFTITRNTTIDYWKKKKEVVVDISTVQFNSLVDEKSDPVKTIDQEFDSKEISKALERLNFEQKEILTLRFISDLSNQEISQLLDKSEEAIRQIQYRAIKNLRGLIKNI
jgi:RNA polymerase sigma-70 factor (ECF subfamily)